MEATVRYQAIRRITLLGAAKNIVLAVVKILGGIIGHSHALFADGIHSLSDVLIDALVLVASRFGSKKADHDHPYGHGRIETAATFLLAFVLSLAGIGIIADAWTEIIGLRVPVTPDSFVMGVALFSVAANEILYRYTRRAGERCQSSLLVTNAWHHRSDSASSLIVLVGIAAAWSGWRKFDAAAAILVGLMIIKLAWQFGWASIRELVDTGLDDTALAKVQRCIKAVPGVRAVHQLRTRSLGGAIFLDVHILVDPMLSVSEGHYIGQQVHFQLLQEIAGVRDVTVHIDPEDDEVVAPARGLPARPAVLQLLQERWQGLASPDDIAKTVLHYLEGKVYVEARLTLRSVDSQQQVEQLLGRLQQALADRNEIAEVSVFLYT